MWETTYNAKRTQKKQGKGSRDSTSLEIEVHVQLEFWNEIAHEKRCF